MDDVLLSIIVPSLNQGELIENAIRSVLGQQYQNWELLIQDGGSTDRTREVCTRYVQQDPRISFTQEKDSGYADAVNKALSRCRGKMAAIQSSDDFYTCDTVFTEVMRLYREHPAAVIIAGYSVQVDGESRQVMIPHAAQENGFIRAESVFTLKNHFAQGATFFSVQRARQVNGLNPKVDMVADTDFWIRLSNCHPVRHNAIFRSSQVWACATIHPEQRGTNQHRFMLGRAKMALAHYQDENIRLDRRFKYYQALALITAAYDYFSIIGQDAAPIQELHRELTGAPMRWRFPWLRRGAWRPKVRRQLVLNNTSMHKLDSYSLGYPLKWF